MACRHGVWPWKSDQAPNNGGAYLFAVLGGFVTAIVKIACNDGHTAVLRKGNYSGAGVNGYNLLQAQCTNEGQGVHLVFSVNGKIVARATDTHNPLTTGTVGLAVASSEKVNKPAEAQFDNFTVTQGSKEAGADRGEDGRHTAKTVQPGSAAADLGRAAVIAEELRESGYRGCTADVVTAELARPGREWRHRALRRRPAGRAGWRP